MATANNVPIIPLEEGWNEIKKGIEKIEIALNDGIASEPIMGSKEYVATYATCYNMCTQRAPYNWSREMYERHGEAIENYLEITVLPALRGKTGQGGMILLAELQHRWINHKIMTKWLKKFFTYLDRFYVKHNDLPTLSQAGLRCFRTKIYDEIFPEITTAMLDLVNDDREGKAIDRSLVKSIALWYEVMGMSYLDAYNSDLEEPLLNSTRRYYDKKRKEWINGCSAIEYLLKAQEALNEERARVADYLNASTEANLLKVVEDELLEPVEVSQLRKASSLCGALLRSGKLGDIQWMFRLLSGLENGLNLTANIAKKFIIAMERPILNLTRGFYRKKSEEWIKKYSTPEYFIKAEEALLEESTRSCVADFLASSIEANVLPAVDDEYLDRFDDELSDNDSFGCLFKSEKLEEVRRVFRLMACLEYGLNPTAGIAQICSAAMKEPVVVDSMLDEEYTRTDSTKCVIEEVINEECSHTRAADFLNASTEAHIVRVVDEEVLERVEMLLLENEASGCLAILKNDKSEELQRMFRLLSRLENGLNPVAKMFQNFIVTMGDGIINRRQARLEGGDKDKDDGPRFVEDLIELHEKYLGVVNTDFSGHLLFCKALNDAFVEIVNKEVGRISCAELISSFCDSILKRELTEQEVEETSDRITRLFSYLTDKDMFCDIYRNQLAKRLLNQRSANDDAEKLIITKLKLQCGTLFTLNMEGMINDFAIGNEQRSEFQKQVRTANSGLDYSVHVLTACNWPTYRSPEVTLTPEMTECLQTYKGWYDQQHQNRKLTWIFSQGHALVQGTYDRKVYDFQLTTLQAVALNAFNGGGTMTFKELSDMLNLEAELLKPVMHSLSCGAYRVVNKIPPGNKIAVTDKFTANSKFTSNMRKIRIPMASLDSTHNTKRVKEDRTFVIEAAIVRIMKARTTLPHQQLIAEVLAILAFFKPSSRDIKKRIEALIDREYLERSEDDSTVYKYLA